jgi:hypothetical protein
MKWTCLFPILFVGLLGTAQAEPWTYSTPDGKFRITVPFTMSGSLGSVATHNIDGGGKRTGFYVNSVNAKPFDPDIFQMGIWSQTEVHEDDYDAHFLRLDFGTPGGNEKVVHSKVGGFPAIQLDRSYTQQGKKVYTRVVGIRTPQWSHSFSCRWYGNRANKNVETFFHSLNSL